MPATMTLPAKLKEIEDQLAEARSERVDLAKTRDAARDAFALSDGLSQDSPEYRTARDAQRALGACDDRIADLQAMQVETLRMLGRDAPSGPGQVNGDRNRGDVPPWPGQTMGTRTREVLADSGLRDQLHMMSSTSSPVGRLQLGEVIGRDAMVADVSGTDNMRRGDYLGVVPQLRRQFRILDLIPTGTMDMNTVPYTQESGTFNAAETAEGDVKPEDAAAYTDQEAIAATIAAWQKLRKQALSDFPALQSMIDGRLRYGVELRLENEIMAGDGTSPNMLGILNTSGLGSVSFDAAEPLAELILTGIVNVLLADGEANAIVMHPTDWKATLVQKSTYTASAGVTGGSGEYVGGGPFQITPQVMWGVPLIPSKAIPQGTALVSDFARGAQLFIRQGVTVLLSDSDQDDFIRNKVTLLGEMRAALAVFRPVCFQKVALTGS